MLTKQDIFDLVEEEDVRFIRLQFTDMLGTMRNLAITCIRLLFASTLSISLERTKASAF